MALTERDLFLKIQTLRAQYEQKLEEVRSSLEKERTEALQTLRQKSEQKVSEIRVVDFNHPG